MHVGIMRLGGSDWLGGAYYTRSVAKAIRKLGHTVTWIEISPDADRSEDAPQDGIVRAPAVPTPFRAPLTVAGRLLGHRNPLLELAVRRRRLDVVLPLPFSLGSAARPGWIGWIPDFQHAEQPSWFSAQELQARDRGHARLAREAPVLALSSEHAARLAEARHPGVSSRVAVLRFAASLPDEAWDVPTGPVLQQQSLSEPFVYLPNQFWAHKNHRTAFRAWALLGDEAPLLVCTGRQEDRRNPGYFSELTDELSPAAAARVRLLGVVPRDHQLALYRAASVVLNPSLYEGWSTTVEESLAFGKRLVLSDLPVFREQAGDSASYFPALDPAALANTIQRMLPDMRLGPDPAAEERGRAHHRGRVIGYEQALSSALSRARMSA